MTHWMLNALRMKYMGDYEVAKANVRVYMKKMVGIGEHPDFAEAIDSQISLMVDAKDKLGIVESLIEELE